MPGGSSMPKESGMPGVDDVPHVGTMPCDSGMPGDSSTPGADTVDVRRMLQIGMAVCQMLAPWVCHMVALCQRLTL